MIVLWNSVELVLHGDANGYISLPIMKPVNVRGYVMMNLFNHSLACVLTVVLSAALSCKAYGIQLARLTNENAISMSMVLLKLSPR